MDIFQLILLAVAIAILWFLFLVLKEIRVIRTLLELPSDVNDSYNKQLNELNEKISIATISSMIGGNSQTETFKAELRSLLKKRDELLVQRREDLDSKKVYTFREL